ncbi:prepilin-type N-terminal cleavage/methylation domain-containing protein [Sulfuriferula thiophila]|uniref:prepilin-type N-terminal cleavage/methylation domain-containing protein n=1 Tax=Sulfuriferula thiophila TaxID=1781211 RepID=UPI0016733291|nr:prepilin-type N-terminal cleavage/methylation domain-containing protein [Sulfuriferula thiophila]
MVGTKQQSGFTLIEIAIVLVIVGLLLGGILKGQELITQAKIRNVVNDFNGTSAAYYAYQDRYRAIPGDDPNAATRWTGTKNGDGDGAVQGSYNSTNGASEAAYFWQHLRLSGLIAGATTDKSPPQNAASGITGVQNGALGFAGLVVCSSNLPAKIAQAVDSQFDDGDATTGQVKAVVSAGTGNAPAITDPPTTNYVDDGTNVYVVCKNI